MTTTTLENASRSSCPFCGCHLKPLRIEAMGRTYDVGFMDCECEGAKRDRAEQIQAQESADKERRRQNFETKLHRAGIPERYLNAEHPKARMLADSIEGGYYIYGSNGTGKTLLAMAIARKLIARGFDVQVAIVPSLLESMRNRTSEDRDLTSQLEKCEVLILDDLGKESATAYACERLFDIVNRRYNALATTIVTSNYSMTEVAKHLPEGHAGSAISSRFSGWIKRIHMDGADRRLSNA